MDFADTEQATECLDHLQTMLWEGGDHSQDDEVTSLICMLQSPLFRQLLVLQDSLQELEQVHVLHDPDQLITIATRAGTINQQIG